jgi:hypothetical protein
VESRLLYRATCKNCCRTFDEFWFDCPEQALRHVVSQGKWARADTEVLCPKCQRPTLELPEASAWWNWDTLQQDSIRARAAPVYEAALRHALGAILRPAEYNRADMAAMITKALAAGGQTP